jgi:hypothetical protein
MKKLPLVLFLLLIMAANAFAQTSGGDKILGVWLSENKDARNSCTLKLKDGKLNIRGYVGVSLLGRTSIWERY